MKNITVNVNFFCIVLFCIIGSLSINAELNLDIELTENSEPVKWFRYGDEGYTRFLDNNSAYSLKNSLVIENQNNEIVENSSAWALSIPTIYQGEALTISAFIKTENVRNGYAGLFAYTEPEFVGIDLDNNGITGTTDWTEYSITLNYDSSTATKILIGAGLSGKGKIWIDKLTIKLDGKQLSEALLKSDSMLITEKDNEFDNGTGINFPNLDASKVSDLELLGKVWGFLKYYHPEIAAGKYHWDYELFRFLTDYLKVNSIKQRNALLLEWVNSLGEVSECLNCKETNPDAVIEPDHDWLDRYEINSELKDQLLYIYQNRSHERHFYVADTSKAGNPLFKNESLYSNFKLPDSGLRLLALYRYWNVVNYYFPSKHLTDQKWDTVLEDYIVEFIDANTVLGYQRSMVKLIAEINDTHGQLIGNAWELFQSRGEYFPPFIARFIEGQYVVFNYFNPEVEKQSGLTRGDVITHINGIDVLKIVHSKKPFYPASNAAVQLRDIAVDLLRSNKKFLEISYLRNKSKYVTRLKLYRKTDLNYYTLHSQPTVDHKYKFLTKDVAYINLQDLNAQDVADIKQQFLTAKGLIFDLRNYPNSSIPFMLSSFVTLNATPYIKYSEVNFANPGEVVFKISEISHSTNEFFPGKVVVLVNEITQSRAETLTMAFMAGTNTTIMGSTTAGANGNVSYINLPGDLKTQISGLGVYYPDGRGVQRTGLVPDITIKPTVTGITDGRDEVLEKAIEFLNSNN